MDKYRSEIFGEFTYSQRLTYEELISCETELMDNLTNIFHDGGADHLDFTPLGDLLMSQCAFEVQNLEIFRDMAQEIAFILPQHIKGRLFCLQKNLKSFHIFWLKRGQWQEQEYPIPVDGPEGAKINLLRMPKDAENE